MGHIPIISIVGKSDSGKTSFLEQLIPRLKAKGLQIATIKHDVHGFSMDRPGKDTWRHKESGADMVIISSPKRVAMIKDVKEEYTLDHLFDEFGKGYDLILTEGYKRGDKPKIEIHRPSKDKEPLCSPVSPDLLTTVTNRERKDGEELFDRKEIERVVRLILDYLEKGGSSTCLD